MRDARSRETPGIFLLIGFGCQKAVHKKLKVSFFTNEKRYITIIPAERRNFMKELLYGIVELIAKIHSYLLHLNDAYEYNFSDKELHFLVIGILGMMFIFVVYPVFKWLAKHDHVMVIAWIYVFTLIIVITFAIEIGQKVTNTGNMEFADIVFGVVGFIVMFFIFAIIREIYKGIISLIRDVTHQEQNRSKKRHQRAYDEYEEEVMDEDDEE